MSNRAWKGYFGNVYFEPIRIAAVAPPLSYDSDLPSFPRPSRAQTVASRYQRAELCDHISMRSLPISRSPSRVYFHEDNPRKVRRPLETADCRRTRLSSRNSFSRSRPPPFRSEGNISSLLSVSALLPECGSSPKFMSGEYVEVMHASTKNFPIRKGYSFISQAGRVHVPIGDTRKLDNANLNTFELLGKKLKLKSQVSKP